jgi:hypothetical protein
METPGNYINGYQDFGSTLREQKYAALVNCVPIFVDNLQAAGFNLPEFFLALSTHCDRLGYSASIIKSLEELAQDFEKK